MGANSSGCYKGAGCVGMDNIPCNDDARDTLCLQLYPPSFVPSQSHTKVVKAPGVREILDPLVPMGVVSIFEHAAALDRPSGKRFK